MSFVNDFFSVFLTKASGEIEYDERQMLVPGLSSTTDKAAVRLLVLNSFEEESANESTDDESDQPVVSSTGLPNVLQSDDLSWIQGEALLVARELNTLLQEGVAPEDIAILGRTNEIVRDYAETLQELNLPVSSPQTEEGFSTPHLRQMEALVQVLDNPLQDIPLAAVLRAHFIGEPFTNDELSRLPSRSSRVFHEAFFVAADPETTDASNLSAALRQKAQRFVEMLNRWRMLAQHLPLPELLQTVLEFRYLDLLSASEQTEALADAPLLDWAALFSADGEQSLFRFARFLEALRAKGSRCLPLTSRRRKRRDSVADDAWQQGAGISLRFSCWL